MAVIAENQPTEFVSIRHLGVIENGVEDTTSDTVRAWAPAYETYRFSRAGSNAIAAEGPPWNFGGASIRCLPTQHANVEHCSYLVQWHDKRLFFSGGLENLDVLSQEQEPLDAIFTPAWLASESTRIRAKFPAARIVIDHHRTGEAVAECDGCLIPAQGTRFTLTGAPIPASMP